MKGPDIARRRMRAQHLWGPPLATPEEVVRSLAGMQAQEYAFAKWSVAQRAKGVDDAAMEAAFAEGRILRTHVLRPTWHFVLPEDIRWMLELTGPRVLARMASGYRELGLDERTLTRSTRAIAKALAGGETMMRSELRAVLEGTRI
ncbi:MAG: crosslink repair DNA glycosylase YcaQ family protein, partial [Actinomycetota bacterium]